MLERLREWEGLRPAEDPKENRGKSRHARHSLCNCVKRLARVNSDAGWRVLLLLDGLDELLEQEQPSTVTTKSRPRRSSANCL